MSSQGQIPCWAARLQCLCLGAHGLAGSGILQHCIQQVLLRRGKFFVLYEQLEILGAL